jgi:REP element-mobilizing transposase RayT
MPKPNQRKRRKTEHGGSFATLKRRAKRPLNINQSHHITMKSHFAVGPRSLFRHKKTILKLIHKSRCKFRIKVYEYAIQGNHIHLLVKAKSREELQNFFRVVAGHIAQKILADFPLKPQGGGALKGCKKNQRKFWSYLLYSRIITWGREFRTVTKYIQKNALELLQIIAYQPRSHTQRPSIKLSSRITRNPRDAKNLNNLNNSS